MGILGFGRRRIRRQASLFAVMTGAALAVATVAASSGATFTSFVVTPDLADVYAFSRHTTAMQVIAPITNAESNLRMAWYNNTEKPTRDGLSCATWLDGTNALDQQGAALRIAHAANGQMQLITVTKNVIFGATWIFNAHLWSGGTGTLLGGVDLSATFAPNHDPTQAPPMPWDLCARVVNRRLDFIAWPAAESRPAWGDPAHSGSWILPAAWVYPGVGGWYVGHLRPGDAIDDANLSIAAPPPPPTTTTTGATTTTSGVTTTTGATTTTTGATTTTSAPSTTTTDPTTTTTTTDPISTTTSPDPNTTTTDPTVTTTTVAGGG